MESIGNIKEIELENYNPESLFAENGIYIGEFEDLLKNNIPALFYLSKYNGLCFLTNKNNRDKMHKAMQSIVLRILLEVPNGMAKLKMYDPTGLGDNLIFLSQLSEKIKGENILIDEGELKRMLQKSVAEIPVIIQKVLGHKYRNKSLIEYNLLAGELAKAYNLLLLTDYPHSFNKDTDQQLNRILQSGKRAGFFTFVSVDTDYELKNNYDINPLSIINKIPCIYESDGGFYVKGFENDEFFNRKFKFKLNTELPDNLDEIIDFINSIAKQVKKVDVSLMDKLTERNFWSRNSNYGIETPIGKLNFTDTKDIVLSIEDGVSDNPHHCLIGGATGSGKTVLLHNIICNTAWLYSPEEVQLYLLDYKEGTEFKIYEKLPHVKVLSVRSEREFGVSVLEYLNTEIERRGDLFKQINVSNISKYNELSQDKLPRIIIIIDEFQKLLDGPTNIANNVSKSLDDIGRRGRSFGVNLILSTQSLAGININQVLSHLGLRITLKLNSTRDADQLLGFGNHSPFSFTKKGEAVYNSRSGLSEGNTHFQVAYIPDRQLKMLIDDISNKSDLKYGKQPFKQFIYDGSLKPDAEKNPYYNNKVINNSIAKIYVGEAVSLQEEHVYFKFRKQNESNVLIVGQDIECAVSLFKHCYFQLTNQSEDSCELFLCNKLNIDNDYYSKLLNIKFSNVSGRDDEIETIIENVHQEMQSRINGKDSQSKILLGIFDIYNIRNLRKNGMMPSSLGKKLNEIISDGPVNNIHCLIYSYSFQGLNNVLDTMRNISDFDTKIALKDGQSNKVFGSSAMEEISSQGLGIIDSPFSSEKMKFKIYNIS